MTTPTLRNGQKVKPHLHAIVVHPGISRRHLSRVLGSVFKSSTGDQPVRVERITDRIGAGGRWVNGPNRVVSYFLDKSAVKGGQRSGDVLAQIAAFEGLCSTWRWSASSPPFANRKTGNSHETETAFRDGRLTQVGVGAK